MFKTHIYIIWLLFVTASYAQKKDDQTFGIKYDPIKVPKVCLKCESVFAQMPQDVSYGVYRFEEVVYFGMTDQAWFDLLLDQKGDGLALDIIPKSQYECGKELHRTSFVNGIMTKPLYLRDLKSLMVKEKNNFDVLIPMCTLPQELAGRKDLEFNLLVIKGKQMCKYLKFYDLPQTKLELLKLDLFMDTLSYEADPEKLKERQLTFHKSMEFTIPFEKNKYEYKPEDLYPLRDSLLLNYYNITSLKIKAFSSVEGSLEKNIELQTKRAESITSALETFQNLKIARDVSASENWVEFLNDILGTKYAHLKNLNKAEVKKELEKKSVNEDLEPILKKHRKGVLLLEMEKKSSYTSLTEQQVIEKFQEGVRQKNIAMLTELQQVVFQNVNTKKYDAKIIDDLEVPEEVSFLSLLSNKIVFKSNEELANELTALTAFKRLQVLSPKDLNIKYNIAVLNLRLFSQNELVVNRKEMAEMIKELEKGKYDPRLVRRLWINYNLIMCEYLMFEKKYSDKDKALQFIYFNYKNTPYNDEDLLRLAKYFVAYNKEDWAIKVVESRVNKINISEDLLYYYINLTISDKSYTSMPMYRTILFNAYNANPVRFCKMYDTAYTEEGISFQLLEDNYLRRNYCESCDKAFKKL